MIGRQISTHRYANSKSVQSETDPAEKQISNTSKRRSKKDLGFGKQAKGAKDPKLAEANDDDDDDTEEEESVVLEPTTTTTPWYADTDLDAEGAPTDPSPEEGDDATLKQRATEETLVVEETAETSTVAAASEVDASLAEGIDVESPDKATPETLLTEVTVEAPIAASPIEEAEGEVPGSGTLTTSLESEDSGGDEMGAVEMERIIDEMQEAENAVLELEASLSAEAQRIEAFEEEAAYIAALEAKMRLLDEKIADILEASDAVVQATQASQLPRAEETQGQYSTSFAPDRPDVFLPVRPSNVEQSRMRTLKVDTPSFMTGESFISGSPERPGTSGGNRIVSPPPQQNAPPFRTTGSIQADREDVFQPARLRSDVYMPGSPQSITFSQARTGPTNDASNALAVDREDVFLPGSTHPDVHLPGSPTRFALNRNPPAIQSLPVDTPGFASGDDFISGAPVSQTATPSSRVQPKSPLPIDRADLLQPGTAHPDVYLPGSPQPSTTTFNRNPQPLSNESPPPTLPVDRPEALEARRPTAQSDPPSRNSPAINLANDLATKLRAIPMDTPGGSFDHGDAFVRGTPPRSSAQAAPSPGADAPPSFTADRPDVFLPATPRPATSKPSLTSQQLAANRPTLPVDTPAAFKPDPDWKK